MSRGRLLALASFVAVVLPALVLSDNLHSLAESTSFDRLMLGLRWLEPQGSRWDPNFPLGTAVLMAIPHALGLDPVAWGRGLSLLCAAGAGAVLFALVRRAAGDLAAGAAVAGMWWVPAVTRGAVVTGEEAPYLLCLLLALYGMVRGAEERAEWRWLALSVLAANAMALVRLDAMTVVPLMGVLGVLLLGVGRGALLGAACFVTTMLHMAAAWRISGDPIGFARVASMNTQRNADGFDFLGPSVLPVNVAGEVGWTVLLLALPGAVWLWRACATKNPDAPGSRPAALALLGAWAWMFVVDFGLTTLGAMEARTMRYLVPLLVLVVAVGAVGAIRWGEALAGPRWVRWMLPAGFAITLLAQGPAILRQATQERLPAGLTEAAGWLGSRGDDRPVVVGEQHPVFVVVGGLDWARTGVLPPGAPGENRGPVVADVVGRAGAGWLVQGEGNPPEPAIESGAPGATERHRAGCCVVWELP